MREIRRFGTINEVIELPNLTDIQILSYNTFLQKGKSAPERENMGLQSAFKEVFPIDETERGRQTGLAGGEDAGGQAFELGVQLAADVFDADIGIAGGEGKGILFKKGKLVRKVPMEELMDTLIVEVEQLAKEKEAEGQGDLAPAVATQEWEPLVPQSAHSSTRGKEIPVLPRR